MEGIALQTMDRSSAAADNDSAALSPGRLGNIESPPPQRDPPPIPSSAEATSSPSPVIDNGCDAIVDSSRGRIEALSSALEQTFASTRDAIHFFKKTSELHDAHARGLLKLHDESTKVSPCPLQETFCLWGSKEGPALLFYLSFFDNSLASCAGRARRPDLREASGTDC
jgi:hypothetical protein